MKNLMAFLLLLAPVKLLAGNNHPQKAHSYQKVASTQNRSVALANIIKKREGIWNSSYLSKENRHQKILCLYDDALPLLESAQDYIYLLKDTKKLAPTTDVFIEFHLNEFFSKKPTLDEVIKLSLLTTSVKTAIAVKGGGLNMVRDAGEFLILAEIPHDRANKAYKRAMTQFIERNSAIFANTKPTIENVITLQNSLFNMQLDVKSTTKALIALKSVLIKQFDGDDLVKLLDYGCSSAAPEYREETQILIAKNYKDIFDTALSLKQVIKLNLMIQDQGLLIATKNGALKLIKTPADFIRLVKAKGKMSDSYYGKLTDFIRNNLTIFKDTKPSIDEVIELQNFISSINYDIEKTVATLMKLKETFLGQFFGSDLIRLMGSGTENPSQQYLEQIELFKRMYVSNLT